MTCDTTHPSPARFRVFATRLELSAYLVPYPTLPDGPCAYMYAGVFGAHKRPCFLGCQREKHDLDFQKKVVRPNMLRHGYTTCGSPAAAYSKEPPPLPFSTLRKSIFTFLDQSLTGQCGDTFQSLLFFGNAWGDASDCGMRLIVKRARFQRRSSSSASAHARVITV